MTIRIRILLFIAFLSGFILSIQIGRIVVWNNAIKIIKSPKYQKYTSISKDETAQQLIQALGRPSCIDFTGYKGGAIQKCEKYSALSGNNVAWVYSEDEMLFVYFFESNKVVQKSGFTMGHNMFRQN